MQAQKLDDFLMENGLSSALAPLERPSPVEVPWECKRRDEMIFRWNMPPQPSGSALGVQAQKVDDFSMESGLFSALAPLGRPGPVGVPLEGKRIN